MALISRRPPFNDHRPSAPPRLVAEPGKAALGGSRSAELSLPAYSRQVQVIFPCALLRADHVHVFQQPEAVRAYFETGPPDMGRRLFATIQALNESGRAEGEN